MGRPGIHGLDSGTPFQSFKKTVGWGLELFALWLQEADVEESNRHWIKCVILSTSCKATTYSYI
jgi:hypothetical protein